MPYKLMRHTRAAQFETILKELPHEIIIVKKQYNTRGPGGGGGGEKPK